MHDTTCILDTRRLSFLCFQASHSFASVLLEKGKMKGNYRRPWRSRDKRVAVNCNKLCITSGEWGKDIRINRRLGNTNYTG